MRSVRPRLVFMENRAFAAGGATLNWMSRGKGQQQRTGSSIRDHLEDTLAAPRAVASLPMDQAPQNPQEPARSGTAKTAESRLRDYESVRATAAKAVEAVDVATGRLLDEESKAIFADHPDLVGFGWTDEPNPYYDENCSVQLGGRWEGGGMVVRRPDGSLEMDPSHRAAERVRALLSALDEAAVERAFGVNGVAVLLTPEGDIRFEFDGSVIEGEGHSMFEEIQNLVSRY